MIDKYSPLEDVPTSASVPYTATKQNSMDICNKEEYATNDTYQYVIKKERFMVFVTVPESRQV